MIKQSRNGSDVGGDEGCQLFCLFLEMFWPDVMTSCKEFPQSHQCYLAAWMFAIIVVGVATILVRVMSFDLAMLARTMSFEAV